MDLSGRFTEAVDFESLERSWIANMRDYTTPEPACLNMLGCMDMIWSTLNCSRLFVPQGMCQLAVKPHFVALAYQAYAALSEVPGRRRMMLSPKSYASHVESAESVVLIAESFHQKLLLPCFCLLAFKSAFDKSIASHFACFHWGFDR